MADNTTLNTGSGGDTIATDDIGGVKHQRVKIQYGTDGAATDVSDSNPLPIDDAGGSLTVDNAGTFVVQEDGAALTALQLIDDAIHTDDAAFTAGTDKGIMTMGFAGAQSVNSGDAAALACNTNGVLHVNVNSQTSDINISDGGNSITVDGSVTVSSAPDNLVSTNNSTTSTLGGGGTYTGTGEDVSAYTSITIQLDASHDSATDGMTFEFSTDNSNWDDVYTFDYTASDGARRFQLPVTAQYFRINYTNGGSAQTHFRVQTILHKRNVMTSIHRLADDTHPDRSAEVVKAALVAQAAGSGNFVTVAANASGKLQVASDTGLDTDIATIAGAVSGTEMQVDIVASLPAGTNAIGKLSANSGVDIGDVDVTSISAGSNLIGDVGISGARTSGGTTLYKNIDVDESEDQVKGSAGQVFWIHAMNLSSSVRYLKLYNATAASVTVGTTVPDLTFPIPTQGDTNGAGFVLAIPNGIAFGTAITIAATTGVADNDSGAPGANEVIVNMGYA
jgi:hypothetical protein